MKSFLIFIFVVVFVLSKEQQIDKQANDLTLLLPISDEMNFVAGIALIPVIVTIALIGFGCFCFCVADKAFLCVWFKVWIAYKKKIKSCCAHLFKFYIFMLFQLFFIIYLFLWPRACVWNVCQEKMQLVENRLNDIAEKTKSRLIGSDAVLLCPDEDVFDSCEFLPPDVNDENPAFGGRCAELHALGLDNKCECASKHVYSELGGWLTRPSPTFQHFCLGSYLNGIHQDMKEKFNDLGNHGLPIKGLWVAFNTSEYYLFPLAEYSNLTFHNAMDFLGYTADTKQGEEEGRECFMVNKYNNESKYCVRNYDAAEQNYFKANVEKKRFDWVFLCDATEPGVNDPFDYGPELLSSIMDDVFHTNDRWTSFRMFEGGYNHMDEEEFINKEEEKAATFYHLNHTNKNRIKRFCSYNLTYGDDLNDVQVVFNDAEHVFENQLSYQIHPGFIYIWFIRSNTVQMPNTNRPVLAVIFNNNHPLEGTIQSFCTSTGGKAFVLDESYLLHDNTNTSIVEQVVQEMRSFIIQNFVTMSVNGEIQWIKPYNDEQFGKGKLITTTYNNFHEGLHNIIGIDLDWELFSTDYCHEEKDIDVIDQMLTYNNLVIIMQICGICGIYAFYLIAIFIYEHFAKLLLKWPLLSMLLNAIYDMNHVTFVILLALQSILNMALVDYVWGSLMFMAIIVMSYFFVWTCGIFCLKVKKFSPQGKKKTKEYVRMKGLSLVIDTIEFDGFIKGTFKNFEIKAGEVTAIMGHSGAGKSTFFNILLGTYQPKKLEVIVSLKDKDGNDQSTIVSKLSELKPYVGFVPQFEIVPTNLTVFEQLWMQTQQKYKKTYRDVVDYYCKQLGLSDELKDKFPHELSGGQRKRLSILKELVSSPPILLLDEPTTGLDSIATVDLIDQLKELAAQGIAIVLIIHQPSTEIIKKFDKLYLFLKSQESVTCAQVDVSDKANVSADVIDKFLVDPDSYLVKKDIVREDFKRDNRIFQKLFQKSFKETRNCISKWISLVPRIALEELRDRVGLLTDMFVTIVTACALFIIFNPLHAYEGRTVSQIATCVTIACQDIDKSVPTMSCSRSGIVSQCAYPVYNSEFYEIFVLILSIGLISLICSLRIFGGEKKVMRREFRSGVSYVQYYITKLVIQIPRVLLLVFLYLTLVYSAVCLKGDFWFYYVICLLLYLWVMGIGVVCSLFFPKKEKAVESTLIGIVIVLIQNLFSGIFVTQRQLLDSNNVLSILIVLLKFFTYSFYGNNLLYTWELSTYMNVYRSSVDYSIQEYGYIYHYIFFIVYIVLMLILILLHYAFGLWLLRRNYIDDKGAARRWIDKSIKSLLPPFLQFDDLSWKTVKHNLRRRKTHEEMKEKKNYGIWCEYDPKKDVKRGGESVMKQEQIVVVEEGGKQMLQTELQPIVVTSTQN